MVSVDDTALAVTDSGGPGRPVVYLNGSYANKSHWRLVITTLGSDWRHITYDERARGKSKRSADYSFEGCVRDLEAVLAARGVARPILVGWSYGAAIAVHWADRNPDRLVGIVAVDGAIPFGITGQEARERIRRLFGRMRLLMPVLRPLGLAARMSTSQHAEVNIEANEITAAMGPVLERLTCPVRFILATGASLGSDEEEMERMRTALDPVLAHNPNITVSAKVASNHSKILRNDYGAVAGAVRATAAAGGTGGLVEPMMDGLTIGQAASFAGVTVKTVRHYHQLRLLDEPQRDGSGYRRYGSADLMRLVQVRTLAAAGVPLAEIGDLLDADPDQFAAALVDVERRLTDRIEELIRRRETLRRLTSGHRVLLSDRACALLDRIPGLGFSADDVALARDGLVLVMALVPEGFEDYLARIEHGLDDPAYVSFIKRCWQTREWDASDPRVGELAAEIARRAAHSR
jgi:DNA-binding transcriptional MerR regulator